MKRYLYYLLITIWWLLAFVVFAAPVVIPMVGCIVFHTSPWLFLLLLLYIPLIALFVMWSDDEN